MPSTIVEAMSASPVNAAVPGKTAGSSPWTAVAIQKASKIATGYINASPSVVDGPKVAARRTDRKGVTGPSSASS